MRTEKFLFMQFSFKKTHTGRKRNGSVKCKMNDRAVQPCKTKQIFVTNKALCLDA